MPCFKTAFRQSKRTISWCSYAGLLQMVSEPVVGRCASEDAGPPRDELWYRARDQTDVPAGTLGSLRGWSVTSYIGWE
ncbi:hypothetical protein QVD17_10440 [Tagetes erecta]|uniref:Uncharacterized protein n=1 Tax=Tagetes erecta TaxID=13708 RepID=A0AAD8L125_TARER|nr:hypothetical protein QVD17_10440 [Tagetes erecta]